MTALPLTAPPATAANWGAILGKGEDILWQARPNARPFINLRHVGTIAQGGLGLVLFLYLIARINMGIPPLWDVRAIVLLVFFKTVPIEITASALRRRWSSYAITQSRALIVTQLPFFGLRVRSFPIADPDRYRSSAWQTLFQPLFRQSEKTLLGHSRPSA